MKILNFTAIEILPALLSKQKTQTIRPAWKKIKVTPDSKIISHEISGKIMHDMLFPEKPPRFKVGEQVKLLWKQRSKYGWFNKKTGEGEHTLDVIFPQGKPLNCFEKILGTVKITEVFKIEMSKSPSGKSYMGPVDDCYLSKPQYEDLAKRDGFSSAEQMFNWFDKTYDLSQPKKFYCYRWKWN